MFTVCPGASAAAQCASGGTPTPHPGSRSVGHASRISGACPAGDRTADCLGASLDGCQGLGSAGGGADLCPSAGIVHTVCRDASALSDLVGLMAILSEPRGAPGCPRFGRT